METEREINAALAQRNKELRERLQEVLRDNHNLREEAMRQHDRADAEQAAWQRTHDAMNVLHQDAMRVLEEHSARSVYSELELEREAHRKLQYRRRYWMRFARQSIEMKALLAQKVRDLEVTLEEMRQRATDAEAKIEQIANQAQTFVNHRDGQLIRIEKWTGQWNAGEIGALEAIAGVLAELDSFPLPSVEALARRRASRHAQTTSLMNEAIGKLVAIECLLEAEGVQMVSTQVQQVEDYIRLQKNRDDRG